MGQGAAEEEVMAEQPKRCANCWRPAIKGNIGCRYHLDQPYQNEYALEQWAKYGTMGDVH